MNCVVIKNENVHGGFVGIVAEQEEHYDDECESEFISINTHVLIVNKMQMRINKLEKKLRQKTKDIESKNQFIKELMAQNHCLESNAILAVNKREKENPEDRLYENVETIEGLTETLSATTSDMDDATMSSEESCVSWSSIVSIIL